jgi:hypothetical protein
MASDYSHHLTLILRKKKPLYMTAYCSSGQSPYCTVLIAYLVTPLIASLVTALIAYLVTALIASLVTALIASLVTPLIAVTLLLLRTALIVHTAPYCHSTMSLP